jgi:hypothetical protein
MRASRARRKHRSAAFQIASSAPARTRCGVTVDPTTGQRRVTDIWLWSDRNLDPRRCFRLSRRRSRGRTQHAGRGDLGERADRNSAEIQVGERAVDSCDYDRRGDAVVGSDKTLVLGPEYDERLRLILRDALHRLGGRQISPTKRLMGGSQELDSIEVEVAGQRLVVESETYVGLSISGPADLVDRIYGMVKARLDAS